MTEGRRFEIRPLQRLGGVVPLFGDIKVEIFGGVGRRRAKDKFVVAVGIRGNRLSAPVRPGEIQPLVACLAGAAQFAIGDQSAMLVGGQQVYPRPVVKLLCAASGNRRLTRGRLRIFRPFLVTLVDATDWVFHRAVGCGRFGCMDKDKQ